MSKLSNEEFQAYLKQIRELAEGPLEEIQKEVEVTNKFPQEFYDLAIQNDLYRCSLPEEYGGYGLNELEILQVQRTGRNENASSLCNGFKLENSRRLRQ